MRHLKLLLLCMIYSSTVMSQNVYIEHLLDSITIKKEIDKVYETIESTDSLRNKTNRFCVYLIYDTFLNDNDIDPSNITEDYYLDGTFLKDSYLGLIFRPEDILHKSKTGSYMGVFSEY